MLLALPIDDDRGLVGGRVAAGRSSPAKQNQTGHGSDLVTLHSDMGGDLAGKLGPQGNRPVPVAALVRAGLAKLLCPVFRCSLHSASPFSANLRTGVACTEKCASQRNRQ